MVFEGSYFFLGMFIVSLVSINFIKLEFDVLEKYSWVIEIGGQVNFCFDGKENSFQVIVIVKELNIDLEICIF